MQTFYFHFYNQHAVCDPEGEELPDMRAVQDTARKCAAQIMAEEVMEENKVQLSNRIEVTDEGGRLVHTLRFSDLVE